ncbi:Uncharacterised protein r2_g1382 [Pycnogonum litorale]
MINPSSWPTKWLLLICILLRFSTNFGSAIGTSNDFQEDVETPIEKSDHLHELLHLRRLVELLNIFEETRPSNRKPYKHNTDDIVIPRGKKAISLFAHWKPFKPRPPVKISSNAKVHSAVHGRSSRPIGQPLRWGRR